jgi:very-short-patch-repair endonuclease
MEFDDWLMSTRRGRRSTRLACVSAAIELGLEVLRPPEQLHLWAPPSAHVECGDDVLWHRTISRAPILHRRVEPLPSVLSHVAGCLPHAEALVVWESAVRRGIVTPGGIRRIAWHHPSARELSKEVTGLSDSLIETLAVDALRHAGIAVRQQVNLLGHRVDALVGDRLVLQFDGHAFHAGPGERRRDAEHDARLMFDGFSVLRFTYAHVVGDIDFVVRTVAQAMEQGRRLADARRTG